jgi:hypothetical protein
MGGQSLMKFVKPKPVNKQQERRQAAAKPAEQSQ